MADPVWMGSHRVDQIVENATFLLADGLSLSLVADRLGMKVDTLDKMLARRRRP